MKIYVAGKYQEREQVRGIYRELRDKGHKITVDWTDHDIYPHDAVAERLSDFAEEDVRGVKEADLFIGLMTNDHVYKGLWVEMGVALGEGMPVWIIGMAGDTCIFMNHPRVRKFSEVREVLEALCN